MSAVKKKEAQRRRAVVGQRGSRSAQACQHQVSLTGPGAGWRITNLRQVAEAMAQWA